MAKGKVYEIAFALNGKMGSSMKNSFKQANKMVDGFTSKLAGIATTALGAIGVSATVGSAFGEAMNMEGFRMQLETATKSAEKAGETMQWAVELANKTPFETGEMVEAAARLEAMGLSAKKYLPQIGDMAGATNKSLLQATEAIIDAQTGEMERMKEFSIQKADIAQYAYEKMGKIQIINNKNQIVNQEKFNEAMLALMNERFVGGMEKQGGTLKGLMSTVSGVLKSGMATMVGITSKGEVVQGSLYESVKGKVKELADTFSKWQSDGTFNRIGQGISETLDGISSSMSFVAQAFKGDIDTSTFDAVIGIIERFGVSSENASAIASSIGTGIGFVGKTIEGALRLAENFLGFITSNWTSILPIVMGAVGGFAAFKATLIVGGAAMKAYNLGVKAWTVITQAQTIAQGALNLAMSVSPVTWLALAIGALVAIGVVLWKNWDTIQAKAMELGEGIRSAFGGLCEWFSGIWSNITAGFKGFINFFIDGINFIVRSLNKIQVDIPDFVPVVGGQTFGINIPEIPRFATGTTGYNTPDTFIAGEEGPELVTRARGFKVFTTSQTEGILNKKTSNSGSEEGEAITLHVTNNITVNGGSGEDIEQQIIKALNKPMSRIVDKLESLLGARARRSKSLSFY